MGSWRFAQKPKSYGSITEKKVAWVDRRQQVRRRHVILYARHLHSVRCAMTSPRRLRYTIGGPRALRKAEKTLLAAMLDASEDTRPLAASLDGCRVQDMNDGGMGCVRIVGSQDRCFGSISSEASFLDEDGTPVLVAVILDQHAKLYELDVWKVDGTRLQRIPPIAQVDIGHEGGRAS